MILKSGLFFLSGFSSFWFFSFLLLGMKLLPDKVGLLRKQITARELLLPKFFA
jgi:hypothetical protein